MIGTFELLLMGLAVVIDVVLLLIVSEHGNRPKTANWLRILTFGLCLVHGCNFFHLLIQDADGVFWLQLDRLCFSLLTLGFLILPSGMLHAAIRLSHTGVDPKPVLDRRYGLLYIPLLIHPVALWLIWQSDSRNFFDSIQSLTGIYLVWQIVANLTSAILFYRIRSRIESPGALTFFIQLSLALVVMTIFSTLYVFLLDRSQLELPLRLLTVLLPLFPAVLFVWNILHQRMLPIVVERTFLYGGVLAIVLLVHRLLVSPLVSAASQRLNLDILLIEWICIFILILVVRPLRQRARGVLLHLLSYDPYQLRDITRQLSVELSQKSEMSVFGLASWFAESLHQRLAVDSVQLFLDEPFLMEIHSPIRHDTSSAASNSIPDLLPHLAKENRGFFRKGELVEPAIQNALESSRAEYGFLIFFRNVRGIILLGGRLRSDRLSEEQMTSIAMLCDQFAATLYNRHLEMERLNHERKSMQQEKLSVLGLMAGSIAHEIRNPLSSIRTIAMLMKEDLANAHEHQKDLGMIVGEIDRLTQTTHRLLDYAKPSSIASSRVIVGDTIRRILHILEQYARQSHVELISNLSDPTISIFASEASLSEIIFNLARNAIEAASEVESGCVKIALQSTGKVLIIRFQDNGKGIPAEVREHLCKPFVTGKPNGTGLGLYAVSERVRELKGSLHCLPEESSGITFEVHLPLNDKNSFKSLSQ